MWSIGNASALTAVVTILAAVGCQSQRSHEPMTADLERDLSLASATHAPRTGTVSAPELRGNAPSDDKSGVRLTVATRKRAPSPAKSRMLAGVPVTPAPTDVAAAAPAPVASRGAGGGAGGIIGAIIRGTSVGIDNCEPAGVGAHGQLGRPGVAERPLSALLIDVATLPSCFAA